MKQEAPTVVCEAYECEKELPPSQMKKDTSGISLCPECYKAMAEDPMSYE